MLKTCLCDFRCLDSILHAEHKSILEEMRVDYDLIQSTRYKEISDEGEEDSSAVSNPNNSEVAAYEPNGIGEERLEGQFESFFAMPSNVAVDLKYLFDAFKTKNVKKIPNEESRFGEVLCASTITQITAINALIKNVQLPIWQVILRPN